MESNLRLDVAGEMFHNSIEPLHATTTVGCAVIVGQVDEAARVKNNIRLKRITICDIGV